MTEASHGHRDLPWTRVYLVVAEYYAKYPEFYSYHAHKTASSIINFMKSIISNVLDRGSMKKSSINIRLS